ncbi:hypothetical protein WA1_38995 [Scytonema hofmannii PCC 7110]|uniref:Uncharacterized protein n=1 Tax=Scytonema hofmannii PCC 7110 TaxID=128403 RepID=A0A139X0U1_9CYAN|nr:hypothetical protein [Scytonema hofmannii]KYC38321.1 hypothetical protein WA1_38995 [Scytonema hofmannii PCC 7110]
MIESRTSGLLQKSVSASTGHWSLVTGHWSLVTGHWSLGKYFLFRENQTITIPIENIQGFYPNLD